MISPPTRATTYGFAVVALATALLLRYLLDPWLGDAVPLFTVAGAVAAATWFSGYRAAIAVSVSGYVLANYLFMAPRGTIELAGTATLSGLVAYAFTCGLIISFGELSRRAQRSDLERRGLLASIVESSDDAIISKSLDGTIRSWNAAAERMFGYTAAEAVGRHISLVIPSERLFEEDQIVASLRAGHRIDHFETERRRADGGLIAVSLTISPIVDDAKQVIGASKIVRDITRQRLAEAERQKLVTLVESSTDFIAMCDLDGVPFFVNRAGLEMVGLDSLDEAKRTPVQSFFFPEDLPRITEEFFPSVLARGHGQIDVRFRHFKTGEARWMSYKVQTLPGADGRPAAFATVSQDVTERKRLADSLRTLASELSEADRRKNEFLAMLAHELRHPLAPISNAVRALRLGVVGEAALRSASEMLERQVAQMSRLVDDLLDMSRITRGKIELRRKPIELMPVVRQAMEAVAPQFRRLNHELSVTSPKMPVYLDADAARLAQVIGNLLNNAGKFTDPGGHISLDVDQQDAQVIIRVSDDGIGIAAEHQSRLFEMFAQVDTSLERSRDGLGIGLTLVKALVEMHGGTVDVHSEGSGHGSEFVVRLPLIAEPASRPSAEAPAVVTGTARRVLIVDDSEDGAESLAMLLEFAGHETHKAHDGAAAIRLAERLRPDVVLMDIGLPRMSGYEVCRHIRTQHWGKDLVMIALTGWGQEEDRRRSVEAGFDAHLIKPVDDAILLKMLVTLPEHGSTEPEPT